MSDYRSGAGLTLILSGKFTGKNSIPVFYLFSFQALAVKEGRKDLIRLGMRKDDVNRTLCKNAKHCLLFVLEVNTTFLQCAKDAI